ncbi:MAG: transposase [Flavobacteriaceae bacterium]|nr:transposase [Flavobacteriaceae bacterium]
MDEDPSVQPGYLLKDLMDEEQDEIGEISSDLYPGERLMVCVNPRLREDHRKTREELLTITDSYLEKIAKSVENRTLLTAEQINRKVGQMIGKRNMAKHYQVLDGIYVVRTNVSSSKLGTSETVEAYKSLSLVEQSFRSIKTTSLRIRPIDVYSEAHVKGHMFLCMLGYHMEWHLKRKLAPLLFIDEHKDKAKEKRTTPVGKAQVSDSAIKKQNSRTTEDSHPVHSFKTLMHDLGTLTLNEVACLEILTK